MLSDFEGKHYRTANNWFEFINVESYKNRPINYLEIGAFYGANVISVSNSYGLHNESKLYCIDPWEDYSEYQEDNGNQSEIYKTFIKNINNTNNKDKFIIRKGYSNSEIPKFEDNFFDIIYIDGNHEPSYALEDAVLSFRKLKKNGILIFDDYGWGGPDMTQRGIDAFLSGYYRKIKYIGIAESQVFIQKL